MRYADTWLLSLSHHKIYCLTCDVISVISLFPTRSAISSSPFDRLLWKSSKCFCLSLFICFLMSLLCNSTILPELYSVFKSTDLSSACSPICYSLQLGIITLTARLTHYFNPEYKPPFCITSLNPEFMIFFLLDL